MTKRRGGLAAVMAPGPAQPSRTETDSSISPVPVRASRKPIAYYLKPDDLWVLYDDGTIGPLGEKTE